MLSESSPEPALDETSPPAHSQRPIPKHEFEGHTGWVWSFVFLHDNAHIVSGSEDGTMRKWDCETGHSVGEPWNGEGGSIWSLALSPDGKTIACGRGNGSVRRWDTDGEMIQGVWTGHSQGVRSLSWSPSGGHIVSGSDDGTILIRKAESGEVEVGPIETNQRKVYSLAYSPSGDRIASGGYDETICIWDSNTGERIVGPIKYLESNATSVVWSSDGTNLYSASDKTARVFNCISGTELHHFEHNSDHALWDIALSPEHNLLACVGYGGVAQLWDTVSHKPLGQPFGGEDGEHLYCVLFSRDGKYMAYSGRNCKITLWMVKDIVPELLQTPHPSPGPSCLEVSALIVDYFPFSQDPHRLMPPMEPRKGMIPKAMTSFG
ncbi:WD40 repeat-like protein [Rhizopogon salebrosus TDB-379]|nr:WD40 repeat-like protein [Rhizopogon salebrosus TDB-379]